VTEVELSLKDMQAITLTNITFQQLILSTESLILIRLECNK